MSQARAELAANGTAVASLPPAQNSGIGSFFAWLFGKGNSGDDEDNAATQPQAPRAAARRNRGRASSCCAGKWLCRPTRRPAAFRTGPAGDG